MKKNNQILNLRKVKTKKSNKMKIFPQRKLSKISKNKGKNKINHLKSLIKAEEKIRKVTIMKSERIKKRLKKVKKKLCKKKNNLEFQQEEFKNSLRKR